MAYWSEPTLKALCRNESQHKVIDYVEAVIRRGKSMGKTFPVVLKSLLG